MIKGVVYKAYSSYYYVQARGKAYLCTLRGRLRQVKNNVLVGDEVEFEPVTPDKGVIEKILPRHTLLKRPMVANVDQVVLVFSVVRPDLNPLLVDRFLILAEMSDLAAIICLNKIDMVKNTDFSAFIKLYQNIGYPVLAVSARGGEGVSDVKNILAGKITALAGPSGVGKSSLLNAVEPGFKLVTNEISEKIGRGRHTTRQAELLALSQGGFVVDTPGFSFTEIDQIAAEELWLHYREFARFASQCKFNSCRHFKEPQCAVKEAVANGLIAGTRYDSYLEVLKEISEKKKGY